MDSMIDLHSHILPGIDDGAVDMVMSLEMARAWVADGVSIVACTPHILPGLFHNTGSQIRIHVAALQQVIDDNQIPLRLVTGADNHVTPDFIAGLRSGHLLSIDDTRYVLVEPPHHVAPPRLDHLFFNILAAGYTPILTHPERLTWIEGHYEMMSSLVQRGVWMQLTAGSLTGAFGRGPRYWSERMLDDGLVHIIATDAHDEKHRRPVLGAGYAKAETRVGREEAWRLVHDRPLAILNNILPSEIIMPVPSGAQTRSPYAVKQSVDKKKAGHRDVENNIIHSGLHGIASRLQRYFS